MVFEEIALAGTYGSEGRLDVAALTIEESYRKVEIAGYEVKASRGDLLADIDSRKYEKYLPCLSRFYFAIRSGIAKLDEIPAEAGVLVYVPEKGVWRAQRRPSGVAHRLEPDAGALLRMLRRMDYDFQRERNKESRLDRMEKLAKMEREEELAFLVSDRLRRLIYDAKSSVKHIEDARRNAQATIDAAEGLDATLAAAAKILGHASRAVSGVAWGGPAAAEARRALEVVSEAIEAETARLLDERKTGYASSMEKNPDTNQDAAPAQEVNVEAEGDVTVEAPDKGNSTEENAGQDDTK